MIIWAVGVGGRDVLEDAGLKLFQRCIWSNLSAKDDNRANRRFATEVVKQLPVPETLVVEFILEFCKCFLFVARDSERYERVDRLQPRLWNTMPRQFQTNTSASAQILESLIVVL